MRHFCFCLMLVLAGRFSFASGPVANNDSASVLENSQVYIFINVNDTDNTGGALHDSIIFPPTSGSAMVQGNTVLYKPQHGFFGRDSFQYQVCDTLQLCATAEVYVLVRGTNLPPVVLPHGFVFPDTLTSAVLDVLLGDADPGNDTLYVAAVINIDTTINLGTLAIDSATGQVVFIHNPLTCGTEVFECTVCNTAFCDTSLITINVSCPDSIFLPQGFSPNGDGKNDLLVFKGLEYFSPASLNVFNRYGASVYLSNNYLNNWDGTDMDSHHALPDGTYFYVLTLPSGKTYNNYIIINR